MPQSNSNFQVLVDSDAFVGRMYRNDPHYHKASSIFQTLKKQQATLVTTSLVIAETATVLSHREGQALAKTFLSEIIQLGELPIIHITETLQETALDIFKNVKQRGTSVTDCANVAVIEQFSIPYIFSFDKVYPKTFAIKMVDI